MKSNDYENLRIICFNQKFLKVRGAGNVLNNFQFSIV